MSATDKTQKIENPAAAFAKPLDVINDSGLSHDQKTKALDTWEQDARQLLSATNEGMPAPKEGHSPKGQNKLRQVVNAKGELGEKPKSKPSH